MPRVAVAGAVVLAAVGSTALLLRETPELASDLSLRYAWYGIAALAVLWGLLEVAAACGLARLARAASLLGILTLAQVLAIAVLQLMAAWFSAEGPSLVLGSVTLVGLPLLVAAAVAVGPVLLRRLTALP